MNYEQARQAIAHVEKSGGTKLSLSPWRNSPEWGRESTGVMGFFHILFGARLDSVPPEIGRLTKLIKLDLSVNRLKSLPPEIGRLTKLRELDVSQNWLESLPPEIGQLVNLNKLVLSSNRLKSLPPEFGGLTNLKSLDLHFNQLESLPPEFGRLSNLESLNLNYNDPLESLPPEFGLLTRLKELELPYYPALKSPPLEIVKQGIGAILSYLQAQLQGGRKQWRAKLVVVGEGGAGKTSLLRRLRNEPFSPTESTTHGITNLPVRLSHPEQDKTVIELNAWDFGGQEIYHATHQFFLSDRALFLLVWNARQGWRQSRLDYWLELIRARAPGSPILLVATHIDERMPDLPEDFRDSHPQIVAFSVVSNLNGKGVSKLQELMGTAAAQLPLMGELWPDAWLDAAEAAARLAEKYTTVGKMREHMASYKVEGDNARVLLHWLHERGDVVHFRDDPELNDLVLLKPHWVSQVISRVLDSRDVKESGGLFTRQHMDTLWADIEPMLRDHLLRLMERFDLSYRTAEDRHTSIVVENLPAERPRYESAWESVRERPCNELAMTFQLNSLPAGIPTWFIAREHRHTLNMHWRHGALLADGTPRKHLALIEARPEDRSVRLTVRGPFPQTFFALLQNGLEVTLRRYPGLKIKRLVPCPGHGGKPCEGMFIHEFLLASAEGSQTHQTVQCNETGEPVSVTRLLFGWEEAGRESTAKSDESSLLMATIRKMEEMLRNVATAGERHQVELVDNLQTLRRELQFEEVAAAQARRHADLQNLVARLARQTQAGRESVEEQLVQLRANIAETTTLLQREFSNLFRREQSSVDSHCPSVFVLRPYESKNLLGNLFWQKMELLLFCEQPGCWHPVTTGGRYELSQAAKWLTRLTPHLRRLCKVLKHIVPMAGPLIADEATDFAETTAIQTYLDGMEELLKQIPQEETVTPKPTDVADKADGATLRVLHELLVELDASKRWGGLRKVLTPEDHWLWLCERHATEYDR